jgi:hypothetical protein
MPTPALPTTTPKHHLLEALLLAAAFAVAHTQSPLYYSNQNQYLLHGAALAHYGYLDRDWLANTRDPTPLFSLLVAGAFAIDPWLLQPAYFVLLMGYFLAARWLVAAVPAFPNTRPARITFAALFTAAHAGILRWASVQLTGFDYPWGLQAGLAAQYLLGPGLQPSAFGVLLLSALAAFAHQRPTLACALAAGTCWFHSTYLVPAALLVSGFLLELLRTASRAALVSALVSLAVVTPVVAFTVWRFEPFGPDSAHAAHIFARVRIPHHCVPARWFDAVGAAQLVWMVFGLFLLRRSPPGRALAIAALGGAVLTGLQLATDSDALALLFPWRISVLLVPVATAVACAKVLAWKPPGNWGARGAGAGLVALVAGGVIVTACGLGYRMVDEHEIAEYIRATARPTDVYLVPAELPAMGTGRGAVSNTFTPLRAKSDTNQIPVELQRFRLMTGASLYVDFKSVPYAPAEVQEWYQRMELASELTTKGTWTAPGRHRHLKEAGITHVVWPSANPLAASYLVEEHRAGGYIVYRVR